MIALRPIIDSSDNEALRVSEIFIGSLCSETRNLIIGQLDNVYAR